MVSFKLKSGRKVIPTSFHGARFSDGTAFAPSESDIAQIRSDWSCLTVDREFIRKEHAFDDIGIVESVQTMTWQGTHKLREVQEEHPNALILVPFMVLSTLKYTDILGEFPNVVAANATAETARSCPQEKVWDIFKFAR